MRFCVITCCNVFNVLPKTILLLPMWPRDTKRLDTPESFEGFYRNYQLIRLGLWNLKNSVERILLPPLTSAAGSTGCFSFPSAPFSLLCLQVRASVRPLQEQQKYTIGSNSASD